ncbi:uncharacterized protein LOC135393358 [Ornithodoros turicata]|uniref:uncharacterized protein LOC135393358 n=1 Tax=Ornithodoros turicata TaxID=34597 RepID=UPI00313956AF
MEQKCRASRPTHDQFEIMLHFMMEHRNLFTGVLSPSYTHLDRQKEWTELAAMLNSSGGAVKTVDKWRKTWTDWKSSTKSKAARIAQHSRGTGWGPPPKESLTSLEEQLASMIGQTATSGIQGTEEFGVSRPPSPAPVNTADVEVAAAECEVQAEGTEHVTSSSEFQLPEMPGPPTELPDSSARDRNGRRRRQRQQRQRRAHTPHDYGQMFLTQQRLQQETLASLAGYLERIAAATERQTAVLEAFYSSVTFHSM